MPKFIKSDVDCNCVSQYHICNKNANHVQCHWYDKLLKRTPVYVSHLLPILTTSFYYVLCRCYNNYISNEQPLKKRVCTASIESVCTSIVTCEGLDLCHLGCTSVYRCANNDCVSRETLCDGFATSGCAEDDEWQAGIGFKCVRNGRTCHLPQQLLYDDVKDCDNGEDICFDLLLETRNVT